ncbi:hypothetical protein GGR26_002692 [Lewinella marina]|uniref:Secretion system C-terminal sorting domain-containing protein n=1 Tax=Neolewinella marina TaxID=438751 RepID=A0A2G0CD31_9BACT|nr:T9SS type A sorting domain-containing protein [Neolewinella marina]NJB86915.1 hypothetical protein [Neolewinella marina]PHK97888.1 hypothetical protein CGL56_13830 [Neolewinella marina]
MITDLVARRNDGTTVTLTWEVESTNIEYRWTLERRFDTEGAFVVLRHLSATQVQGRKYLDPNPHSGTTYYRIRGSAPDGAENMSPIRAVVNDFDPPAFQAYPNPVHRAATVRVPATEHSFTLSLANQLGRRVWTKRFAARAHNPVSITLPDLPPGVYLLRWTMEGVPAATIRVVVGY